MAKLPDAVQLTRRLLEFDTINPPGNEEACARYLGDLLQASGFQVDYSTFAASRTSLIARIGQTTSSKAPLGFTGHLDTVPLGAAPWKKHAFGASLEGGRLYGRGSSDMKSGVAAFVVAALAQAERLRESPGVTLVLTADEECGCGGAAHLARETSLLGRVGALLVGEPTANYPLVGHKGALWLEARTTGVTAHGSMPERGDNAVHKAARAITALQDFDFNFARHAVLGGPTLNVGTIKGGLNINSVPDRAAIGIDIRTIPGQNHAKIRDQLASYLGDDVALSTLLDAESVWTS